MLKGKATYGLFFFPRNFDLVVTYLVALRNGERAFEKSLREVVLLNSMDTYQCKRGLINCPHIIVIIGINIVSKKLGHEMREFFGVK